MIAQTVTVPVDQETARIVESLRAKAEARGLTLDSLFLPMSRQVLELLAIQAHQADLITEQEVIEILGFEDREELWEFFKRHDVRSKYTTEDFLKEGEALEAMLASHNR